MFWRKKYKEQIINSSVCGVFGFSAEMFFLSNISGIVLSIKLLFVLFYFLEWNAWNMDGGQMKNKILQMGGQGVRSSGDHRKSKISIFFLKSKWTTFFLKRFRNCIILRLIIILWKIGSNPGSWLIWNLEWFQNILTYCIVIVLFVTQRSNTLNFHDRKSHK